MILNHLKGFKALGWPWSGWVPAVVLSSRTALCPYWDSPASVPVGAMLAGGCGASGAELSKELFYCVVFFLFPILKLHQNSFQGLLELEGRDFWVEAKSGKCMPEMATAASPDGAGGGFDTAE